MTDFEHAFTRLDAFIRQHMLASNNPGVSLAITGRKRLLIRLRLLPHVHPLATLPVELNHG